MDTITQTEICKCGRGVVEVTGVCQQCIHEGAVAFWKVVGIECPVQPVKGHTAKIEITKHRKNWGFEAR